MMYIIFYNYFKIIVLQITFSIASNEHCEHILDLFMENGIGIKLNSRVV